MAGSADPVTATDNQLLVTRSSGHPRKLPGGFGPLGNTSDFPAGCRAFAFPTHCS